MKAEQIKSEGLSHEFKIVVGASTLEKQIDAKLKTLGAKAKVPGFRPGHIPMKILKQRYGASIMGETIEEAVQGASRDLVREKSLKPALRPKLEIIDYKEGGDLEFTMKVEVLPEIPEFDFTQVKVDRLVFAVDDKEIDEAIERLAEKYKDFKTVEAAATEGNVVVIDFVGKLEGTAFEGGSAKKFRLTLGSGQFIPGFEDQLIGAKAGDEKIVSVSFPKEYHKEDLAGKPVEFDVTVHEVLESIPPAIDDTFAGKVGFSTLDALKQAIREQLNRDYTSVQRQKLKKQIFDALEEKLVFETPAGMRELEFNSIWGRLQEARKAGEAESDKPEEELKKEYAQIADRRVRLGLILADIGTKNKLAVTKEEVTRAVFDQARQFPGQEKQVIDFYQQNPEHVEDLRGPILEEKAVDWLLERIQFNDKTVSIKELLSDEEEAEASPSAKKNSKKKEA